MEWTERNFSFGEDVEIFPPALERLKGTPVRLAQLMVNIDDNAAEQSINGKWSIKENIGHLIDIDQLTLKRIDEINRGVEELSPATFKLEREYNSQPLHVLLNDFWRSRQELVKSFEASCRIPLKQTSFHKRLNIHMTAADLAHFCAEHDDHHLITIRRLIENII